MAIQFHGMPGGAQVWRIDGKHLYLMWRLPTTAAYKPPMLWHIPNTKEWKAMTDGLPKPNIFDFKSSQVRHAIKAGKTTQIDNTEVHPFASWVANYNREAKVNPMLRDKEVLALFARGIIEGRPPTQGQLESTKYWQSKTPGEREWIKLSASDPRAANQKLIDNRIKARELLYDAGFQDPSNEFLNYLADPFTKGKITEDIFNNRIIRETDPFHPDASPFAGKYLSEGDEIIKSPTGKLFIRERLQDGNYRDWELTGPGQKAKYGAEPDQFGIPSGKLYQRNGKVYLRTRTKPGGQWLSWYSVEHDAGEDILKQLYGTPEPIHPNFDISKVSTPNVLKIFGSLENFKNATGDMFKKAGDAQGYFDRQDDALLGLPNEDKVQQLVLQWIGPVGFQSWTPRQIGEWARKLRENPGQESLLIEHLKKQRLAMFPEHENSELNYDDISSLAKGLVQQAWGEEPDENDPFFTKLVRMNDAHAITQLLRQEGIKKSKGTVVSSALEDAQRVMGSRVQGGQ